jgi:hypothetical protein
MDSMPAVPAVPGVVGKAAQVLRYFAGGKKS